MSLEHHTRVSLEMSAVQIVTNLDGDLHIDELTHFCPGRGATIVYVSRSKSILPFLRLCQPFDKLAAVRGSKPGIMAVSPEDCLSFVGIMMAGHSPWLFVLLFCFWISSFQTPSTTISR